MSIKKPKIGVNDLESQCPNVAKYWDYKKNEGLTPNQVFAHSDKAVWWTCDKGHSYQMVINNKTGKFLQGCPICSGKRIVSGINDISTTYPDIVKHWDYSKNGTALPSHFGAGSNVKVYWLCDKKHSFKARIFNMTHTRKQQFYCPVCDNVIVQVGYNDLGTTHPELIKEWDYEKNNLLPTQVPPGSHKIDVWWKCLKYGHSWKTKVYVRTRMAQGCPICSNQRLLKGFNDTATILPEIVEYWDYDLNDKGPDEYIGKNSNHKVFLKCRKGHSWKTAITSFARGDRCPFCGYKRILVGFNDLATTHPLLVEEWDYEKNDNLTPQMITYGSDKKVWWKCKMGHSWKASINSRVRGNGCPVCSREYQTSIAEKALCFYLEKFFPDLKENIHLPFLGKRELDIFIPSLKLGIEFDGSEFHKNFQKDLRKDNLCYENGIEMIRIREEGCPTYVTSAFCIDAPEYHGNLSLLQKPINEMINYINRKYSVSIPLVRNIVEDTADINERFYLFNKSNSLENKQPELSKQWNYEKNGELKPSMVSPGCNSKVWWKCDNGHEWQAVVAARVRGNGCPYCSGKAIIKGINDLNSVNPALAAEWNYEKNGELKPNMFSSGSNKKVWWKCKNGHEWQAVIWRRNASKLGCPYCSGLLAIKGETDLETLFPNVASQWDYEKNGNLKPSDILPGSEKKIWWICDKGHSYPAVVRTRTYLGTGCPVCQNKRIIPGLNDLTTLQPRLATEWNYEKNGGLLPSQVGGNGGSHKKVWWICDKGHEWPATLSSRIHLRTGCPQCYLESKKKK